MSEKVKLATLWLDGCSGCHMSLLDVDDFLLTLADKVDVVYSPLVDAKIFPENVDVTLVEGAVSTEEDLEKIRRVRQRTKLLISLGDCAVAGNIPAMRNRFLVPQVLQEVFGQQSVDSQVPRLLDRVRPIHEVVKVDLGVPGCPPNASVIRYILEELLAGRQPDLSKRTHFG